MREQGGQSPEGEEKRIRLVSSDGYEEVLPLSTVLLSRTLSMFLNTSLGFEESTTNAIVLYGINGRMLERVADFLRHRKKWEGREEHPVWEIGAEESLDLLLIADYLEM